jgi:hypothetical protein
MTTCPDCAATVREAAVTCPQCGALLVARTPPPPRVPTEWPPPPLPTFQGQRALDAERYYRARLLSREGWGRKVLVGVGAVIAMFVMVAIVALRDAHVQFQGQRQHTETQEQIRAHLAAANERLDRRLADRGLTQESWRRAQEICKASVADLFHPYHDPKAGDDWPYITDRGTSRLADGTLRIYGQVLARPWLYYGWRCVLEPDNVTVRAVRAVKACGKQGDPTNWRVEALKRPGSECIESLEDLR